MQYMTIDSGALTSFPLSCQIKKMTTASTRIAVQCEWIKMIPIIYVRPAKNIIQFLACHRIVVIGLCVWEMNKVENRCPKPLTQFPHSNPSTAAGPCHKQEIHGCRPSLSSRFLQFSRHWFAVSVYSVLCDFITWAYSCDYNIQNSSIGDLCAAFL